MMITLKQFFDKLKKDFLGNRLKVSAFSHAPIEFSTPKEFYGEKQH